MKRVNKANPCPACGKDSWCLYDENSVLCMRNSAGRPHLLKSGEQGWWHDLKEKPVKYVAPRKEPEVPKIDAVTMLEGWARNTKPCDIHDLADELSVKPSSLIEMGIRWSPIYRAWAWPMRDSVGKTCGIRLRASGGKKWSVTGSKSGIFLPWCAPQKRVWICEGGTDCAALLSLNCYAIGRPSCSGGTDEINATIKRLGIREAVIISDNDEDKQIGGRTYNPGADGAKRLSERLIVPNCVITLPCKDAREFLALKGDASMLESLTQNTLWKNPHV
jgi:hypothetical protein